MGVVNGSDYGLPTLDLNFARTKSLIDTVTGRNLITFARSSTGTYVGADGLIKYAAVNEPRFDHSPTSGESLGLLVEESRTNNVEYSNDFSNAYWTKKDLTIITNDAIAPDGTNTAQKLIPNTTATNHTFSRFQITVNSCRVSVYVKYAGWRYLCFLSNINAGVYGVYDLLNGTASSGEITSVGNGWYRIVSTQYPGSGANTWTVSFTNTFSTDYYTQNTWPSGQGVVATGDGVAGVHMWGFQSENGAFATSIIPTNSGSSVTRSADIASITGINFSSFYNQSEGTWFIDFANDAAKHTTGFDGVLSLDTNTPRIIGSSIIGFGDATNISPVSARQKVGLAYGTTEGRSFNGTISSGSGGVSSRTQVKIGTGAVTASNYELSTTISRLTYYPKRLPNYQLQALTR